jgi:hypothetical protein
MDTCGDARAVADANQVEGTREKNLSFGLCVLQQLVELVGNPVVVEHWLCGSSISLRRRYARPH